MEATGQRPIRRSALRAAAVVGAFAATLALGIILLLAFEVDVQQANAGELVSREDDARASYGLIR